MPRAILLAAVAADFESGTIEEWLKGVGDNVEAGDPIVEVSTEKAVVEVTAEFSGTIGKILVEAGSDNVVIDTPIAIMLLDGEDVSVLDGWSEVGDSGEVEDTNSEEPIPATSPTATGTSNDEGSGRRDRKYASPIARRIAARAGIDLNTIDGSGPHGRVVLGDVEAVAAKLGLNLSQNRQVTADIVSEGSSDGGFIVEPASTIRKVIAQRLTEAKRDIPHFYLTVDCQIDRLLDVRQQLNESTNSEERVSVNDFFIKAIAQSLKQVPTVNVSWCDDAIKHFQDINISVAVATPKGLMTPVLRNVDRKSLAVVSGELKNLAERARSGNLKPEEFKDGGFTISNLGMYGIREFSAIINPPQACILAIGAGEQRPVVRDENIVIATVLSCTLSVDHRAVDGAVGAEFLQALKMNIERPAKLIT